MGAGLVGRRHAKAIAYRPDAELLAVVDPSEAGREFSARHGHRHFSSLAEMFSACDPDGVILATPTPLHVEQGQQCVAQGCPVLIEKPIADVSAQAENLLEQAGRAGVPILVGHHRRHNPLVARAHQLITAGEIGVVRAVHANCWLYKPDDYFDVAPWRKKKGAGPISVNLVHDIDLIRHLCGEIASVSARALPSQRGYENEELAAALLCFESGAVGTISVADSIASPWSWELTARENPVYPATTQSCYQIGGSLGSLSLPDLTLWRHTERPDWWKPMTATVQTCDNADPLDRQMEHFLAVIAGEEQPLVSGLEGLRSQRVVEAIQQSAQTGETVCIERGSSRSVR